MISSAPNSLVRHLRVPGYLFLGIATVLPLLDLLISVYPLRPATVVWRFGAVGLLSSAIGAPLLVLFFVFALAVFAGDRKIIITVGIISAIIALVLIGGAGAFALDALQMKRRVQEAAQQRFTMASIQAMLKLLLEGGAAIVLAFSAFRTLARAKVAPATRSEPRGSSAGLVMGRQSSRIAAPIAEAPPPAAINAPVDE